MAKVSIIIEGDSAGEVSHEVLALAASLGAGATNALRDDSGDVEGEAPPEKPQAAPKSAAAPKATRGRGAVKAEPEATTSSPSQTASAPAHTETASTAPVQTAPAPAAAAAPTPSVPAAPSNGAALTVQDVLNVVQGLSQQKIDAGEIQDELQRVFGVSRVSLIPAERRAEAIEVLQAFGQARALA